MISSKDRILDAAERVVLRDGGAHLTLDAVAAEASLSKGGLLYHYPSKDELIRGMIRRLQDQFEAELARCAAEDPEPAGRLSRAYLKTTLPAVPSEFCERFGRVSAALLAAVATNPALLQPITEKAQEERARLGAEGIDPVCAAIVRLAADGLWMAGLFGVPPLDPDLQARIVAKLNELTRPV